MLQRLTDLAASPDERLAQYALGCLGNIQQTADQTDAALGGVAEEARPVLDEPAKRSGGLTPRMAGGQDA